MDTTGGTDNDLGAGAEGVHVVTDVGTTNAGVALNVHEVTDGDNDLLDLLSQLTGGSDNQSLAGLELLVDLLESGDGESGSLSGTRLGLGNDIVAWDALVSIINYGRPCGENIPAMMGLMARCWIAEGRSKP